MGKEAIEHYTETKTIAARLRSIKNQPPAGTTDGRDQIEFLKGRVRP
jgi:hypothetical protein